MHKIRVTCYFPITLQQAKVQDYCAAFGFTYQRHDIGGEPNNYWLEVTISENPTPETLATIKQSLVAEILDAMVTVALLPA